MIKQIREKFRCIKIRQWVGFFVLLFILLLFFRLHNGPLLPNEKIYNVLRSNNWIPLSFYGKEYNMGAFVDELISEIAISEDLKIYLITSPDLDPHGLFSILDENQYDAIIVTFSPIMLIKEKYIFSNPIYNAGPVLIVPESSQATSLKDLKGRFIAINKSSQTFDIGKEASLFVSYDNMIAALDDLEKNLIAGVIMDAELAQIYTQGFYKGKLKIATPPLTDLGLRLVSKKTPEGKHLIERFNRGLEEAEKKGIFDTLIKKWELTNP